MGILLDTHVLLWSALSREEIEHPDNGVFVSVVSAWEITIEQSLGKLMLVRPAERRVPEVVRRSGFAWAPFGGADALRVGALPWHHRDPLRAPPRSERSLSEG